MKRLPHRLTYFTMCLLAAAPALVLTGWTVKAVEQQQQRLVDEARLAVESFKDDGFAPDFAKHLAEAKAILIAPDLFKAGFLVGGEGGRAVLLARDPRTGVWSYPAFYTVVAGSLGLQAGLKVSEVMFVIRTDKGLEKLVKDQVKLGAGVGLAIATVGGGIEGSTTTNLDADILAFAKSKGVFGGLSLEGAVLMQNEEMNHVYYGRQVTVEDIIIKGNARNPAADPLRIALCAK